MRPGRAWLRARQPHRLVHGAIRLLTPLRSMISPRRSFRPLVAGGLALVAAALVVSAQTTAGTGGIVGRVFNPATQEYVRDAEVAVAGTGFMAYSADDGSFSLTG